MKQKQACMLICFCLLFLFACENASLDNNKNGEDTLTTVENESNIETEVSVLDFTAVIPEEDFELLYLHSPDQEAGNSSLSLINFLTGENLKTIYLSENEVVLDVIQDFSTDYFIVIKATTEVDFTSAVIGIMDSEDGLTLLLEDGSRLPAVQNVVIYDGHLNERMSLKSLEMLFSRNTFIYDGGNLVQYFYDSTSRFIYLYDLNEDMKNEIVALPAVISFPILGHIGGNNLGFYDNIDDGCRSHIGTIEIDAGKFHYVETDFTISQMFESGDYLIFTEAISSPGFCGQNEATGNVLIYRISTHENWILNVDPGGSHNARVIADRYILTTTIEEIKLYELNSGQLLHTQILEVEFENIETELLEDDDDIEGVYPYFYRLAQLNERIFALIFNDGIDGFVVELVEIGGEFE